MERPNMANVFAFAVSNGKINSKQRKALGSLRWRQAYQNSDAYEYTLEDSTTKLTFKQILNGEMKGLGTGTFVWPAAHVMAKYLEVTYSKFGLRGKRVCDVGSGTGLTGLIASVLGAEVTLTDQTHILPLLEENKAAVNDVLSLHTSYATSWSTQQITIVEFDWNTLEGPSTGFDILLISDCVLPKLYPINILIQAVHHLMGPETIALFSYEHRPYPEYDPRMEVQRLCEESDLVLTVVPSSQHHPVFSADDIELWIVRRKGSISQASISTIPSLQLLSWGQQRESVSLNLLGKAVSVTQQPHSSIGCFLWPSSAICSRIILQRPSWLRLEGDGIILDLGAGCGLTTISLLAAGVHPDRIITTDKAHVIETTLKQNIQQYLVSNDEMKSQVRFEALDWEKDPFAESISNDIKSRVKSIVCSDCLYSSFAVSPLLRVILSIAESTTNEDEEDLTVLLVNEQRTALEEFLYLARQENEGIRVKMEEINLSLEDLELLRTSEQVVFAPPLRAMKLSIVRKII